MEFGSICVKPHVKSYKETPPHQLPIYATTSFRFEDLDQGIEVFNGQQEGYLYSRFGNPTMDSVAEKINELESYGLGLTTKTVLVSSGMAAISSLMLALLKPGMKIVTQKDLYGGTTEFFEKVLKPLEIEIIYTDLRQIQVLEKMDNISMIYLETPANPTMRCIDLYEIGKLANSKNWISVCDNTFCTPFIQQPLKFGFDFSVHSTTKFLNGHGNSTGGAIIGKDRDLMMDKIIPTVKLSGTNTNPWDAWMLNHGLKTLEIRMIRHGKNALALAEMLKTLSKVKKVNYPGLPEHPDHLIAKSQMSGFGPMLSFELNGGLDEVRTAISRLKIASLAPTLGDVDTLLMHPYTMSHRNIPEEIKIEQGITPGLIRVSVGIENTDDLIEDFAQALSD
jgi:methionine-gamma-lyase